MSKPLVLTPYEDELWEQAYEQGASDMEQAKQIIIDSLLKQLEQIRSDAIEEYKYALLNLIHQIPQKCIGGANVKEVAEQLKEQKNE